MAATNGRKKADEPVELPGIPVDGEFYTVEEDLSGAEQRELRNVLRELTGPHDGPGPTLGAFLNFGLIDDFDLVCAMTFIIRKRANENYTLDEALELKPSEVTREGEELLKEQRRRPRKPAGASSES